MHWQSLVNRTKPEQPMSDDYTNLVLNRQDTNPKRTIRPKIVGTRVESKHNRSRSACGEQVRALLACRPVLSITRSWTLLQDYVVFLYLLHPIQNVDHFNNSDSIQNQYKPICIFGAPFSPSLLFSLVISCIIRLSFHMTPFTLIKWSRVTG
jgi:hypothetical protein